jgi:hypothetical protein
MVVQKVAVFVFGVLLCLLAPTSNASDDRPSFPILESRIKALNITGEDEVNNLTTDWQAELDAFIGSGSQKALSPQKRVLESRFAWPFLSERAVCPSTEPVACEYNGFYCCYLGSTCCYTDSCRIPGYVCCNSNPGLCCGAGSFCCDSEVVSETSEAGRCFGRKLKVNKVLY